MNVNSLKRTANLVRTQQRRQSTLWRGRSSSTRIHKKGVARAMNAPTNILREFSSESNAVTNLPSVAELEATKPKDCVTRRGLDDDIVTVVVGDKEFQTLKSTLQVSPVLSDILESAQEQKDTQTIFLDRDPKHFPVILQYLRNKVEDVSYNRECKTWQAHTNHSSQDWLFQKKSPHTKYIRLATDVDPTYLQDLYLEATYYELDELKIQLDHATFVVRAFRFLNGGPSSINPFERTKQVVSTLRTTSVAMAGLGTGAFAFMNDAASQATTLVTSFLGS